jgi:hypothetical protein
MLAPSVGARRARGIIAKVDHLSSGVRGKRIRKLRRGLNGAELDEGLLNLYLLVEVPLILKYHFLALMKHIHFLFVALVDGEQTLEKLEECRLA